MTISYLIVFYIVVALAVAIYTFVQGVVTRPRPWVFSVEDQVVLSLSTVAIGVLWALFLPALVAHWGLIAYRWVSRGDHHWSIPLPRVARAR